MILSLQVQRSRLDFSIFMVLQITEITLHSKEEKKKKGKKTWYCVFSPTVHFHWLTVFCSYRDVWFGVAWFVLLDITLTWNIGMVVYCLSDNVAYYNDFGSLKTETWFSFGMFLLNFIEIRVTFSEESSMIAT